MKRRKPNPLKHVLTENQEAFCFFYVLRTAYNGKSAAIMAGYREAGAHVRACRLMKKKKIMNRINELINQQFKGCEGFLPFGVRKRKPGKSPDGSGPGAKRG